MPGILNILIGRIRKAADIVAGQMSDRELLVFYILTPLIIGMLFGVMRAQYGGTFSIGVSLVIWPIGLFLNWVAFEFGMLLFLAILPAARKLPLFLLLVIGGSLGKIASVSVRGVLLTGVVSLVGGTRPSIDYIEMDIFDIQSFILFMEIFLFPIILWSAINYFFIYVMGVPKYGRAGSIWSRNTQNLSGNVLQVTPRDAGQFPRGNIPPILKSIPDYTHEDIICLVSEGNYVRVHTQSRNWLVRYTFGQAIKEFEGVHGMQVHRSYWIYRPALIGVKRNGRSYELQMAGDLVVPVSRANINLARRLQRGAA